MTARTERLESDLAEIRARLQALDASAKSLAEICAMHTKAVNGLVETIRVINERLRALEEPNR